MSLLGPPMAIQNPWQVSAVTVIDVVGPHPHMLQGWTEMVPSVVSGMTCTDWLLGLLMMVHPGGNCHWYPVASGHVEAA